MFLLWMIALLGRMMSLPGVFGAVTYGLGKHGTVGELLRVGHITVLFSEMVVPFPSFA